jgi:hypothetical protein
MNNREKNLMKRDEEVEEVLQEIKKIQDLKIEEG